MLGFVTIFAAALAGLAGLGAWAVGASAIALASLSYAEHYQLYRRRTGTWTDGSSDTMLRNALIAAGGAYIGGVLLRLKLKS